MILYAIIVIYIPVIISLIKKNRRLADEVERLQQIERYMLLKERIDSYKGNVDDAIREADENETWG